MGKGSLVPPYAKHTLSLCLTEKLRLKEVKGKIHNHLFCSQTFSIGPFLLSFLPLLPIMPKVWIVEGGDGGICLSVWVFVCSVSVAVLLCSPGLAWNLLCKAGWPPTHRGPSASGSPVLGLNVSTTPRFFFSFFFRNHRELSGWFWFSFPSLSPRTTSNCAEDSPMRNEISSKGLFCHLAQSWNLRS